MNVPITMMPRASTTNVQLSMTRPMRTWLGCMMALIDIANVIKSATPSTRPANGGKMRENERKGGR